MSEPTPPSVLTQRRWAIDVAVVVMLVTLTLFSRTYFWPSASTLVPGAYGLPRAPHASDPPSMDELWHLSLSTGWGDRLATLPTDRLITDLPSMTSIHAARPWWTVWTSLEHVIHPPLYAQTLRFWRDAFGDTDTAAILYSVTWSCVAVAMGYLTAREIAGLTPAVWVGVILAFSPTQTYFALEIRGYAMTVALVTTLLYVVVRIQRGGASVGRTVALTVLLLATLLTHYLTLAICAVVGVLSLCFAGRGRRARVAAAGAAVSGIYAVVWLPFFLAQIRHVSHVEDSFLGRAGLSNWQIVQGGLQLPLRMLSESSAYGGVTTAVCGLLLVAPLCVAYWKRSLLTVATVATVATAVILGVDMMNQTRMILFPRYCAPMSVAVITAIVCAIFLVLPARAKWLIHVVGLAAVMYCWNYDPAQFPIRHDSPTLTRIAQSAAPMLAGTKTLVVYCQPGLADPWWVAMEVGHLPSAEAKDVVLLTKPMDAPTRASLRSTEAGVIFIGDPRAASGLLPPARVLQTYRSPDGLFFASRIRFEDASPPATQR